MAVQLALVRVVRAMAVALAVVVGDEERIAGAASLLCGASAATYVLVGVRDRIDLAMPMPTTSPSSTFTTGARQFVVSDTSGQQPVLARVVAIIVDADDDVEALLVRGGRRRSPHWTPRWK